MKPAWDQLGSEYETSSSVVVADVDCTVETDLCSEYDVKGYPTIKYFTSETDPKGTDYSGGRTCAPRGTAGGRWARGSGPTRPATSGWARSPRAAAGTLQPRFGSSDV